MAPALAGKAGIKEIATIAKNEKKRRCLILWKGNNKPKEKGTIYILFLFNMYMYRQIARSPLFIHRYSKSFFSPFLVLKRKKYKSMGCVSPKSGDLAMPEKSLDLSRV